MRVSECMQSPAVTCRSDATLVAAARLMEHYNVGSVVVIGDNDEVEGIVTDRDLAIRGVAHARSSDEPISTVMNRTIATIREGDQVLEAADRFANSACRRLPVLDSSNHLVGVVSLDDVLILLTRELGQLASVIEIEGANPTTLR